jgi:hypothetical protein
MATIRVCDRCGVTVERVLDGTERSVVVPQASSASKPVDKDVQISLGIVSDQDLCTPCLVSALLQLGKSQQVLIPPAERKA